MDVLDRVPQPRKPTCPLSARTREKGEPRPTGVVSSQCFLTTSSDRAPSAQQLCVGCRERSAPARRSAAEGIAPRFVGVERTSKAGLSLVQKRYERVGRTSVPEGPNACSSASITVSAPPGTVPSDDSDECKSNTPPGRTPAARNCAERASIQPYFGPHPNKRTNLKSESVSRRAFSSPHTQSTSAMGHKAGAVEPTYYVYARVSGNEKRCGVAYNPSTPSKHTQLFPPPRKPATVPR